MQRGDIRELARSKRVRLCLTIAAFALVFFHGWILRDTLIDCVVHDDWPGVPIEFQGDAAGYYHLILQEPFPCVTPRRPPLFLCLGRITLALFGELDLPPLRELKDHPTGFTETERESYLRQHLRNQTVLRYLSVAYSQLTLIVLVLLALFLLGPLAALLAAGLWALAFWDIYYAVQFLRLDLVNVFNLLICLGFGLLLKRSGPWSRRDSVVTAMLLLTGALSVYTRLSALTTLLQLVILYNAIRLVDRRWRPADLAASAALVIGVVALLAPYLWHNQQTTGSFFPTLDRHARWWASHEFAGEPGFPSRAEVVRGEYTERDITLFDYVFGLHSLPEVMARYAGGYWQAFTSDLPRRLVFFIAWQPVHMPWMIILVVAGLTCMLLSGPENVFTAAAGLVFLFPFAFVLPVDTVLTAEVPAQPTGVEARFLMPLLPFAFLYLCAMVRLPAVVARVRGWKREKADSEREASAEDGGNDQRQSVESDQGSREYCREKDPECIGRQQPGGDV